MRQVEGRAGEVLERVTDFLAGEGVAAYLVGGWVRDSLMHRQSADLDIAVAAPAPDLARRGAEVLGGKYVLLDRENGVARVVVSGKGRRWYCDFAGLRGSIEEDLAHRDFTIDAMAVRLAGGGGEIIDPFAGREDLAKGLVRAVGPEVFRDDPVRMLRAVRLAAEFDFRVEEGTEALIQESSHLVSRAAGERVREELMRVLALAGAASHVRYLDRLGLLPAIIPELGPTRGCRQPKEHYWDVFDHSLETVTALERLLRKGDGGGEAAVSRAPWSPALSRYFDRKVGGFPRRALLKFAALLHDVAKPQTRSFDEAKGRFRFLGHSQAGVDLALEVMGRLRFSRLEKAVVGGVILHHLRPTQLANEDLPSRRAIYRYYRDTADVALDTLFFSLADHWATRGPKLDPEAWGDHARVVEYIIEEQEREEATVSPPKLIDGHDLIDVLGATPGSRLGRVLETVREAQAAGEISGRDEALALAKKQLELERET
ncbi:MAG: HD domain-containing protein [Dehalococcoidia bacterium]